MFVINTSGLFHFNEFVFCIQTEHQLEYSWLNCGPENVDLVLLCERHHSDTISRRGFTFKDWSIHVCFKNTPLIGRHNIFGDNLSLSLWSITRIGTHSHIKTSSKFNNSLHIFSENIVFNLLSKRNKDFVSNITCDSKSHVHSRTSWIGIQTSSRLQDGHPIMD